MLSGALLHRDGDLETDGMVSLKDTEEMRVCDCMDVLPEKMA